MMHALPPRFFVATMLLVATAGSVPSGQAQIPWATDAIDRAARMEFYGIGQYLHSDNFAFDGPLGDVKVEMDDTGLGGFGFGYHFNSSCWVTRTSTLLTGSGKRSSG
jgi:hypothetical protein